MSMDYKSFEELTKKYNKILKEFDVFISDFLFAQAVEALKKTKRATPVDTGALKGAWNLEEDVYRNGNEIYVVMYNPLEYASFIEYGHTKRGRIGWVDGYFMAKMSIQELQDKLPRRWNAAFLKFVENLTWKEGA